jgi:hypothetical protein
MAVEQGGIMPKAPSKKAPSKKAPSKTAHRDEAAQEQEASQLVTSMTGSLDQWRTRIDELKVQVDLAKLDTRERATKQLDIAQNACLAAYSKLREAGHDAVTNADTLREGLQKLLNDVKEAFEAAQAVITRG